MINNNDHDDDDDDDDSTLTESVLENDIFLKRSANEPCFSSFIFRFLPNYSAKDIFSSSFHFLLHVILYYLILKRDHLI
jgi:hypothetical protein